MKVQFRVLRDSSTEQHLSVFLKKRTTFRRLPNTAANRLFTVAHIHKAKFSTSIYFCLPSLMFFFLLTHMHGNCQDLCVLSLSLHRLLFDVLWTACGPGATQESGCLGIHRGCHPQPGWTAAVVLALLRSRASSLQPQVIHEHEHQQMK